MSANASIEPTARPVVLIASSRSDGNTARLARSTFAPDLVEFVDLSKRTIGYYDYDAARAEDDFVPLIERVVQAPLWVLATPLYWYTMSAQAKTSLDRMTDLLTVRKDLGRMLRGTRMAVLVSGSDPTLPSAFDEPFRLTCGYLGVCYLGAYYARFVDDRRTPAADAADALVGARWLRGDEP
jgi:NAD(P)H-dependent FMN reductase